MPQVTPPRNNWFDKILYAALGGMLPADWFSSNFTTEFTAAVDDPAQGIPHGGTQHATIADLALTGTYATDEPNIQASVNGILATLRSYGMVAP